MLPLSGVLSFFQPIAVVTLTLFSGLKGLKFHWASP